MHFENIDVSIETTELGIFMLVNEEQLSNAKDPIEVSEAGSVMLIKEESPANALDSIDLTGFVIIISFILGMSLVSRLIILWSITIILLVDIVTCFGTS